MPEAKLITAEQLRNKRHNAHAPGVVAGRLRADVVRLSKHIEWMEKREDRLVVQLRAAMRGKLAGPWSDGATVTSRSDLCSGGIATIWHASMGWARRSHSLGWNDGTQADADAWLIAHDWTLMTPADQALLDRGGEG